MIGRGVVHQGPADQVLEVRAARPGRPPPAATRAGSSPGNKACSRGPGPGPACTAATSRGVACSRATRAVRRSRSPSPFRVWRQRWPQEAVVLRKTPPRPGGPRSGRQVLQGIAQPRLRRRAPMGVTVQSRVSSKRPLAGPAAPGLEDLQVPQGGLIQAQKVVPAVGQQAVQVGEFRGVGVLQIAEDGPGRGHPQGVGRPRRSRPGRGCPGPGPASRRAASGIEGVGRHQDRLGGRGVEGDQGRGQEGRVRFSGTISSAGFSRQSSSPRACRPPPLR